MMGRCHSQSTQMGPPSSNSRICRCAFTCTRVNTCLSGAGLELDPPHTSPQHWWEVAASHAWGLFISAYLVWYLVPLPLVYYFWGPNVRTILVACLLVRPKASETYGV